MMVNILEKKQTQFRFFALYIVSLLLMFLIVVAFWKVPRMMFNTAEPISTNDSKASLTVDSFLHSRFDQLESAYNMFLLDTLSQDGVAQRNYLVQLDGFKVTLDSLEQNNTKMDRKMAGAISAFRKLSQQQQKNYSHHSKLMQQVSSREKDTANTVLPITQDDMDELKQILVDKEQRILDLEKQTQLAAAEKEKIMAAYKTLSKQIANSVDKSILQNSSQSNVSDLKQKLEAMKNAYAKSQEHSKGLERAYKIIVDDNRRLLTQLQKLQ